MEISTTLAADLARLFEVANSDDDGAELSLTNTTSALQGCVPSYLGLVVSFQIDGQGIVLTSTDASRVGPVGASLTLPLAVMIETDSASRVEFYAAAPGAFVDLAADLQYSLHVDETVVQLDDRLGHLLAPSSLTGIDAFATINRALGMMIESGHTPERALNHLQTQSTLTGATLRAVARKLLDGVRD